MTAITKLENPMKAAISVSSQCRLLQMSRSQYYFHAKRGTFHSPLYLASNNRPYFTASMVEDNLKARETGVGVNGEYVIFYERREAEAKNEPTKPVIDVESLVDGLKTLGLNAVTTDQVEAAVKASFPSGTEGQEESNILRTVFRFLKRSGAA
jgi:hypothetical protein